MDRRVFGLATLFGFLSTGMLKGAAPAKTKVQRIFEKLHAELLKGIAAKTNDVVTSLRGIYVFEDLMRAKDGIYGIYAYIDMKDWYIFRRPTLMQEELDRLYKDGSITERAYLKGSEGLWGKVNKEFASSTDTCGEKLTHEEWLEVLKLFKPVSKHVFYGCIGP